MIETSLATAKVVRKRAARMNMTSWVTLVFIVLALFGGVYLFTSANEIAYADLRDAAKLREIKLYDLQSREKALSDRAQQISEKLQRELIGDGRPKGEGPVAQNLKLELDYYRTEQTAIRRQISLQGAEPERSAKVEFVSPQFVNATITRALIVLALILLLRILAGIHVYTMRMSTHFSIIADAIELNIYATNPETISSLVRALSAGGITFPSKGEQPVDSLRDLIEAIRQGKPKDTSSK